MELRTAEDGARTYGVLRYEQSPGGKRAQWVIEAEPHVTMVARRLWGGTEEPGIIRLDPTPAAATDLIWFMGRYPLDMGESDHERLTQTAGAHEERIRRVQDYLGNHRSPPSYEMAQPPRSYQAREAAVVHESGRLLVADELGLGKTCSAITVLSRPECLPAVIVVPTHLPNQWRREIHKFLPDLSTYIIPVGDLHPLPGTSHTNGDVSSPPDVVIIPYSRVAKWAQVLAPYPATVVFDEAQELRRSGSLKYGGCRYLARGPRVKYRVQLTATPIYNHGDEIWNVLDVIAPGELGSRAEFLQSWCVPVGSRGRYRVREPRALGSFLREQGLMVRHTREEVGRELPDQIDHVQEIGAEAKRLEEIEGRAAELARILVDGGRRRRGEALMAGGELDRIVRQATGLSKAPYVAEFVRLLVETGERVLLGLWHHACYDLVEERLEGIRCVRYTGRENPTKKDEAAERFVAGDADVMMLSLRSGVGLDGLQKTCRIAVFGELDWSPQVMEQFAGRLRRDGQHDPVLAYYLIADSGADPLMAQMLGLKREQSDGILSPDQEDTKLFRSSGDRARRLAEEWLRRNAA